MDIDTRFNYKDYNTEDVVTNSDIKNMVRIVFSAGEGYIASAIAAAKLLVVGIFFFIMWRKMEHDKEIRKQTYEAEQHDTNLSDIANDDLDEKIND